MYQSKTCKCFLFLQCRDVAPSGRNTSCRARRLLVGKTQMTCIEGFEADKAAILGEWSSGDRVDIKYLHETPKDDFVE